MPKFEIKQREIHERTYIVDAPNEAEGIKSVLDGEADAGDNVSYIQDHEGEGMSIEEFSEKTLELLRDTHGHFIHKNDFLSTIVSVKEMD